MILDTNNTIPYNTVIAELTVINLLDVTMQDF
jgi:hypothetical protein